MDGASRTRRRLWPWSTSAGRRAGAQPGCRSKRGKALPRAPAAGGSVRHLLPPGRPVVSDSVVSDSGCTWASRVGRASGGGVAARGNRVAPGVVGAVARPATQAAAAASAVPRPRARTHSTCDSISIGFVGFTLCVVFHPLSISSKSPGGSPVWRKGSAGCSCAGVDRLSEQDRYKIAAKFILTSIR